MSSCSWSIQLFGALMQKSHFLLCISSISMQLDISMILIFSQWHFRSNSILYGSLYDAFNFFQSSCFFKPRLLQLTRGLEKNKIQLKQKSIQLKICRRRNSQWRSFAGLQQNKMFCPVPIRGRNRNVDNKWRVDVRDTNVKKLNSVLPCSYTLYIRIEHTNEIVKWEICQWLFIVLKLLWGWGKHSKERKEEVERNGRITRNSCSYFISWQGQSPVQPSEPKSPLARH